MLASRPAPPGWSSALSAATARVEIQDDRVARFATPYASLELLATWVIGIDGQARARWRRPSWSTRSRPALERVRRAPTRAPSRRIAAPIEIVRETLTETAPDAALRAPSRPSASRCCRRCWPTCSSSCGDEPRGEISASDLKERYGLTDDDARGAGQPAQPRQLRRRLLRGVRRVSTDDTIIAVEKELYGDEFRRPARLSPLEAKAILMALDLVGPQVAADAGTTLGDVRAQGRGGVRRATRCARRRRPVAQRAARGHPVGAINDGDPRAPRWCAIEYLGAQRRRHDRARRRAVPAARRRGDWYVETLRPHARPASARSASTASAPPSRSTRRSSRRAGLEVQAERARAARPLRHRVGVVLARDRAPGRLETLPDTLAARPTAPRWPPSPTAASAGWRPRSASTAATPC